MLNDILILDQLQWHPPPLSFSINFMTLIPNLTFAELRVVSMKCLQRVWYASRARLPFRPPGSIPHFGTCLCSNCWDQFSRTCRVFSRLFTVDTLGTSSILFLVFFFYYFNPEIVYFAPILLGIIAYRFLKLFNTTPTYRVKSVRNRCVIKFLVAFLYCHVAFRIFLWL